MSRLRLEDFSKPTPIRPLEAAGSIDAQEARLQAFEEGYKAGWEDAAAAEAEGHARIGADFAKTLQELSFGYHEARAHILAALGPLLTAMVERVMPQIARAGFARTVVATAMDVADRAADRPLHLRVCPENRIALEEIIAEDPGLPLEIIADDTLGPGQALLSGATGESEIDIDGMLSAIRAALDDFLTTETQQEARRHG